MTAPLYLVEETENRPTTRQAVEELLADSCDLWETFEKACGVGVPALRDSVLGFREALKKRGHAFQTHDTQFEEVFGGLLAAAGEFLPNSPGAIRERLRERVRDDVRPRPGGGVKITGSVGVRRAVEVVLAHEDAFFDEAVLAAGSGHARLHVAARRFWEGLAAIGREYLVEEVEDALWLLVREIAPESPAARPDAGRLYNLWACAQEYVEKHDPDGILGDEVHQEFEVCALNALRAYDLAGYRDALRDLCRAARDAARRGNENEDEE